MATKTNLSQLQNKAVAQPPKGAQNVVWSIMEQGPNDGLTRTDGYGGKVRPVETKLPATYSKYIDDVMAGFTLNSPKLGSFNLSKITSTVKSIKDKFNAVKEMANERCKQLLGRDLNSVVSLAKEFKNDAVGTLTKLAAGYNVNGYNLGELVRTGKMAYQDARRIYNVAKNQDWTSFNGIVNGLTALNGNLNVNSPLGSWVNKFVDIQAVGALASAAARAAVDLGVPEMINLVNTYFPTEQSRSSAFNAGVYNAACRSDLTSVNAVIDVLGSNNVRYNNPQLVRWVLSNYEFDELYTSSRYDQYRQELLTTLRNIDPTWMKEKVGDHWCTRLDVFTDITEDAASLLSVDGGEDDYTAEILIASEYPEVDIKQLVMKMYDDITFTGRSLDARMKY